MNSKQLSARLERLESIANQTPPEPVEIYLCSPCGSFREYYGTIGGNRRDKAE